MVIHSHDGTAAIVLDIDGWVSEEHVEIARSAIVRRWATDYDLPPRTSVVSRLAFLVDGRDQYEIFVANPGPKVALLSMFDECYGLRVIDRNVEESNYLEYGRFRLEILDEDRGAISSCTADGFCVVCEL